jgi:hypothetical protein
VYTEQARVVPDHYIKHDLIEWPNLSGPKKSWWYKLQLFNKEHFLGNLLYFDLDMVVVNSLDWILDRDLHFFWTILDFKRLYKRDYQGINSSMMFWNTERHSYIWDNIRNTDIKSITSKFRGDQDYLQTVIPKQQIQYFPLDKIISWRWQALRGSAPINRRHRPNVNTGTEITEETAVLVFHGQPKPHELDDPVVNKHWQ